MGKPATSPGFDAPRLPRLAASAGGARRRFRSLGPGTRLAIALVLTLAAVGGGIYLVLSDQMHQDQVENYSRLHAADAEAIEAVARTHSLSQTFIATNQLLEAVDSRDGTEETILIGPNRVVRASGAGAPVGSSDGNPNTLSVLREGSSFAGNESDPGEDSSSFEFLAPVVIQGQRYALETAYSSNTFNSQLGHLRTMMALLILLAIAAALPAFYLFGGRSLVRSHQLALQRATRDGLTDLPNHRAFQDDLELSVSLAGRNGDPLALALLDLDHFKQVNDRHGHPEGDALLRRVAEILRNGRSADRPFRIGGDEFAVLLQKTDEEGARTLVARLCRTLQEAGVPVSIGVAAMRPGEDAKDLRAEADAALYEAKRRGGASSTLYSDIHENVEITTAAKREAVIRLVEDESLTTVFQPIWSFDSELLIGLEALSRPDPAFLLAGPSEAFDIAEQVGSVHELDELCVATALRSAAVALPPEALLFLNLAPKTLELDAGEVEWLTLSVEAAGFEPERIVIEVTERIHARTAAVVASLIALRERGFLIALDDVGTGNAGLEMLRHIGAEYVKLDRSIVAAAPTEPNARAVLMAMATFARQTGAFVIAEGIEDEETLSFLRGLEGIEFEPGTIIQGGQGFGLGRPSAAPVGANRRLAARSPSSA
ncbi:MAG TPA: bifunctional diguanylate cyclase/phosphodiesterase [Solirubrobacterales bacterium]|jgi:diguanylate cyclase (GGDEF)-like protein|nr:bifunctional diguanylate cyclase/phosphodiesterase [Solirubrobacterales bacterium]